MGKNKLSSGLINVVTYDTENNISLNSGSNLLMSLSGSGKVTIPGNLVVLGGIAGSSAESSSYALNADKIDNLDSTQLVLTSSFNSYTSSASSSLGSLSGSIATTTSNLSSSIASLSSSVATTTSNLSSSIGSLSSSVAITTSGLSSRINSVETKTGSYATTGSNIFIGDQTITGSICSTGNIVTTGQIVAQTINVQQVTSSIVYSCGSNTFGCSTTNTQTFTGSMLITGSNINAKVDNTCFQGTVCSAGNLLLGGAGTTNSISKYTSTGTLGASQMTTYGNGGYNVNVGWTNCARIGFDNDNTGNYFYGVELDNGTRQLNIIGKAPDGNTGVSILTGGASYVQRFNINGNGVATFTCQVCAPQIIATTSLTANTAYIQPNVSSGLSGLYLQNNSTGGYGVSLGLGLYGYNTSAYFNTLRIESSYPGFGRTLFFTKEQSSSTEVLSLNLGGDGTAAFTCSVSSPLFVGSVNSTTICVSNGIIGTNSNNLYLSSNSDAGEISFWGNQLNTRLMTISGCGCVGIGTNTPSSTYGRLTVAGTGISIADDGNAKLQIGRYSSTACNAYIKMGVNACSLRFTNSSDTQDLLTIDKSGNVGIGCTSPTYHLEVRCVASTTSCYLAAMFSRSTGASDGVGDIIAFGANGVSSIAGMYRASAGSWGLELQTANQNTRMRIDNSGITTFNCQVCAKSITVATDCSGVVVDVAGRHGFMKYVNYSSGLVGACSGTDSNISTWMGRFAGSIFAPTAVYQDLIVNGSGNISIGTSCSAFGRRLTVASDVVAYYSNDESITMGISAGTGAQSWGIQVCDTGDGNSALHLNARGGFVGINKGSGNSASYPLDVTGVIRSTSNIIAGGNVSTTCLSLGAIGHYQNYSGGAGCFALFCASQGAILYVTSMHNGGRSTAIVTYANGTTGGAGISVVNQVTPYGPAQLGFGLCANGWLYVHHFYGGPTDYYAISMNSNFSWAF